MSVIIPPSSPLLPKLLGYDSSPFRDTRTFELAPSILDLLVLVLDGVGIWLVNLLRCLTKNGVEDYIVDLFFTSLGIIPDRLTFTIFAIVAGIH
jgi:hypothetical protein